MQEIKNHTNKKIQIGGKLKFLIAFFNNIVFPFSEPQLIEN